MQWVGLLFGLGCLFGSGGASIRWSKSYTLKAVLSVPEANLTQPYQVWLDGDTGKSRVDFYGGMDKLYRQWDDTEQEYQYFKIHPETTSEFTNREVCNRIPKDATETRMYALNTYLPVKNFKFVKNDKLNGVDGQKWEYAYVMDPRVNARVVHTVWINFKKVAVGKIPVPLRYVYEAKSGENVLDYFRHDYTFYDENKPDRSILQLPFGIDCQPLEQLSDHEPIDPLLDYIEPGIEHSRISKAFDRFKIEHNKKYENDLEQLRRLNIFKNNLRYINSVNQQHMSFSLAVNQLADLTDHEISVFMGTAHTPDELEALEGSGDDDDDDVLEGNANVAFDWRDYGAITAVKDQTTLCGACYAFTTAAAVESAAFIARGCKDLEEVSEQAMLDCTWGDKNSGNFGCSGGTYEYTLEWIKANGIPLKREYGPYLAMEGRCHNKNMTKLVKVFAAKHLQKKKQVIKETLQQTGPLLAAIDSNVKSFTFYSSGVFNDPRCRSEPENRSHGVTLIGYGKESDQEYWIVKNSFGIRWGEQGYMRLAMKNNVCGLKNFVYSVWFPKSKFSDCKKL